MSCGNKDKRITLDTTPAIFVKICQVVTNTNKSFLSVKGKIYAINKVDLSTLFMGCVRKTEC